MWWRLLMCGFLSLASHQAESKHLCRVDEAARLSRLYMNAGMSGLVAESESCHRRQLDCRLIDTFGYEVNRAFRARSGCMKMPYFDLAEVAKRNPRLHLGGVGKAPLFCDEIQVLIAATVDIALSDL